MRLAWDFAVGVIKEWKAWLSGSLPMVVLAMLAWVYPQIAPLAIWEWVILILVGGFVCAAFRVYRDIRLKLDAIALRRPFMFETIKLVGHGPFGSLNESYYHFMVTLIFENRGDDMIDFTMRNVYTEINGKRSPAVSNERGRYIHPDEKFSFALPRIDSVPVVAFPLYVDVFFDAEYDNVPPLKKRHSLRKIKYICYNLDKPETWTNFVIEEKEN